MLFFHCIRAVNALEQYDSSKHSGVIEEGTGDGSPFPKLGTENRPLFPGSLPFLRSRRVGDR